MRARTSVLGEELSICGRWLINEKPEEHFLTVLHVHSTDVGTIAEALQSFLHKLQLASIQAAASVKEIWMFFGTFGKSHFPPPPPPPPLTTFYVCISVLQCSRYIGSAFTLPIYLLHCSTSHLSSPLVTHEITCLAPP